MIRKLKYNALAVPCTLGDGSNGYLGILVIAAKYAMVTPTTPFLPPPIPEPLVVDPDFTQYQIAISKTQYEKGLLKHQAYILMQRALFHWYSKQLKTNTQMQCAITS